MGVVEVFSRGGGNGGSGRGSRGVVGVVVVGGAVDVVGSVEAVGVSGQDMASCLYSPELTIFDSTLYCSIIFWEYYRRQSRTLVFVVNVWSPRLRS